MTFRDDVVSYRPFLRNFARKLGVRDADDLIQDAMIKALQAEHTFVRGSNMKAWLCMILRNTLYSDNRRSRKQGEMPAHYDAPAPITVDARQDLLVAMSRFHALSPRQHDALLLRALGYEERDIARVMNIADGTVKSLQYRARAILNADDTPRITLTADEAPALLLALFSAVQSRYPRLSPCETLKKRAKSVP